MAPLPAGLRQFSTWPLLSTVQQSIVSPPQKSICVYDLPVMLSWSARCMHEEPKVVLRSFVVQFCHLLPLGSAKAPDGSSKNEPITLL